MRIGKYIERMDEAKEQGNIKLYEKYLKKVNDLLDAYEKTEEYKQDQLIANDIYHDSHWN